MGGTPRDPGYLHLERVAAREQRQRDMETALQHIAEQVTDVVGYQIVAISTLDELGVLEVRAVSGSADAREAIIGRRTPLAAMEGVLDQGERWGTLCFIPADNYDDAVPGWVPEYVATDDADDAWLAEDALCAMLLDDTGAMVGMLSVDLPLDGKRPTPSTLRKLEEHAVRASGTIATAIAREQLAEQVWLASATRQIMRIASAELSITAIVGACQGLISEAFGARGLWIQAFSEDGIGQGGVHTSNGQELSLPPELVQVAVDAARAAWRDHRVFVINVDAPEPPEGSDLQPEHLALIYRFLTSIGVTSMLFVPLGAGPEVLGNLVLTRSQSGTPWNSAERAAALDVGYDLGRILLNARIYEKERHLVDELTRLDHYKSRLIATISHELKSPLASIIGHLELLEDVPVDDRVQAGLERINRGSTRLSRIVEDLLTLSQVANPGAAHTVVPIDLRHLAETSIDMLGVQASAKNVPLHLDAPHEAVTAYGDTEDLSRLCDNLVSNAIKYSRAGRPVTVKVSRDGDEVVLAVIDQGIGISETDQKQLFSEFFRSTNPEATAQPGTGLGLTIVAQIVERYGGRIQVRSELDVGSTFAVVLPAAPND